MVDDWREANIREAFAMMIAIYKTIPEAEIRQEAADTIAKVEAWFVANPKRRVCHVGIWYGRQVTIHKGHVAREVNAAAEAAIRHE